MRDLFCAQSVLGGELAARAAERITPEQPKVLKEDLPDYSAALEAHYKPLSTDLGHLLHRQINLASG